MQEVAQGVMHISYKVMEIFLKQAGRAAQILQNL